MVCTLLSIVVLVHKIFDLIVKPLVRCFVRFHKLLSLNSLFSCVNGIICVTCSHIRAHFLFLPLFLGLHGLILPYLNDLASSINSESLLLIELLLRILWVGNDQLKMQLSERHLHKQSSQQTKQIAKHQKCQKHQKGIECGTPCTPL